VITGHRTSGLRPTIIVELGDGNSLMTWGTLAVGHPEAQEAFLRESATKAGR
jgi:hypothetical protein